MDLFDSGSDDENTENRDGSTPLHRATSRGEIELLLKNGISINQKDSKGNTALHLTISEECAQTLLEKGADVNSRNNSHQTPLHYALCNYSDTDIEWIPILIEYGADVNSKDSRGKTPLHYAQTKEMIELLIRNGALVNERDDRLMTALHLSDSEECTKFLLEHGAEVNSRDDRGLTALHHAHYDRIRQEDTWIEVRIHRGLDRVTKNHATTAPIYWTRSMEMIELLLKSGAILENSDADGKVISYSTKLEFGPINKIVFCYAERTYPDKVASDATWIPAQIQHGADIGNKDSNHTKSINWVNAREMIETLVYKRIFVRERGKNGDTVLLNTLRGSSLGETALHGTLRIYPRRIGIDKRISTLIQYGADVNAKGFDGTTPLHHADSIEIIELLLKSGARINEANLDGNTALHLSRSEEKMRVLLENGADANFRNNKGRTPFHKAVSLLRWHEGEAAKDWLSALIHYGSQINALSKDGRTPLNEAFQDCSWNLPVIVSLIENGAIIGRPLKRGRNLLHLAAVKRHKDKRTFEYLIHQQNIDVNSLDDDGMTPLHHAALSIRDGSDSEKLDEIRENQTLLIDFGADINIATRNGLTAFEIEMINEGSFNYSTEISSIAQHMFRLEAAGLYINERNRDLLHLTKIHALCKVDEHEDEGLRSSLIKSLRLKAIRRLTLRLENEVRKLRNQKLNDEWSLLDLLQTADHRYITDRPMMNFDIDFSEYPLYGGLIRGKLISDVKKAGLFEICRQYFSMLMRASEHLGGKPLPSLPHELEVKILSLLGFTSQVNLILCGWRIASELARLGSEPLATVLQLPNVADRPEVANLLSILELVL